MVERFLEKSRRHSFPYRETIHLFGRLNSTIILWRRPSSLRARCERMRRGSSRWEDKCVFMRAAVEFLSWFHPASSHLIGEREFVCCRHHALPQIFHIPFLWGTKKYEARHEAIRKVIHLIHFYFRRYGKPRSAHSLDPVLNNENASIILLRGHPLLLYSVWRFHATRSITYDTAIFKG